MIRSHQMSTVAPPQVSSEVPFLGLLQLSGIIQGMLAQGTLSIGKRLEVPQQVLEQDIGLICGHRDTASSILHSLAITRNRSYHLNLMWDVPNHGFVPFPNIDVHQANAMSYDDDESTCLLLLHAAR